jgi:hypothetical protein
MATRVPAQATSVIHPSRSLRATTSSATSASSRSLLNANARSRISASVTLIPSCTETMPAALCTAKWKSAPADRVAVVAVAGLWPGHRGWRAVIVKPGQGEFVSGLDVAGARKALTMSPPRYPALPDPALRLAVPADSIRQMRGTASTMSTAMMMIRPMRTIACSLR